MIGIRIDIDTVRDAKALPTTLKLLKEHDIRASFFVTTGADETYRNYRNYLKFWNLFTKGAIKRYGGDMFTGLLTKKMVHGCEELKLIKEEGHEVGLHGHRHFEWMNNLNGESTQEVAIRVSQGRENFEKAFGYLPQSFAAPGFKVSPALLSTLDSFGFHYSSDFMGERPFYPSQDGTHYNTLQIPVSLAIEECDSSIVLQQIKKQIERGYCIFYFHPSGMPLFRKRTLEKALELISSEAVPLMELIR
jgi:undecaprenyl phosphate-alpha-L-ara4FN deformylase